MEAVAVGPHYDDDSHDSADYGNHNDNNINNNCNAYNNNNNTSNTNSNNNAYNDNDNNNLSARLRLVGSCPATYRKV